MLLCAMEGYSLTVTQSAVALAVLRGESNARISVDRSVAVRTTKAHVGGIYRAASVADRVEFVITVFRRAFQSLPLARECKLARPAGSGRSASDGRAGDSSSEFEEYMLLRAMEGYSLTVTQSAVALAVLRGESNALISVDRSIAVRTVKAHVGGIYRAASVADRVEFVTTVFRCALRLAECDAEVQPRARGHTEAD